MEKLSYTYRFADGTSCTVFFGEDGVRRKDILRLQRMDHAEELQERYKLAHTDYRFRNAMLRYQKHTTEMKSSPIDWIVDEKADIWEQLYGENGYKGEFDALERAMKCLTRKQRNLVWDLYGLNKTMAEIGRKQHVTEEAIWSRRSKILRRLRKLLAEE